MEDLITGYLLSFPTSFLIMIIAFTLYILSKGANILIDEAVRLSIHFGVPKMIIGATIVSLGTTLPEASVSVLAAINGNPDLALGNAIGSIIVDTGLIIGIASLIGSLTVDPLVVKRQGKIQIWSGILLAIVCLPLQGSGNISQWLGWVFIALLIIYIYSSIKWTKNSTIIGNTEPSNKYTHQEMLKTENFNKNLISKENKSVIVELLKLIIGILLVIGSSEILVPVVNETAIRIGIPQSIIAATLVAFGTSLPELVTAITAVKKGHGELAIGNIVGADILNVLFVIGTATAVTSGGLDVPLILYKLQIPTMIIILITFRLFSKRKKAEISKKEGIILLIIYSIYLILNYLWI